MYVNFLNIYKIAKENTRTICELEDADTNVKTYNYIPSKLPALSK